MSDTTITKVIHLTAEGLEELQQELKELTDVKLPLAVARVAKAREYGDLAENAEYHSARDDQALLEARIAEIEDVLSRSKVVQHTRSNTNIGMGSKVVLSVKGKKSTLSIEIVGEFEADPLQSKISAVSPLGKAVLGKKKGDTVKVIAPAGEVEYTIVEIK
jgi:transcription elongation factor GreA